jgi:hypothetical protein
MTKDENILIVQVLGVLVVVCAAVTIFCAVMVLAS